MPLGAPTPVREEEEAGHTPFYPVALATDVHVREEEEEAGHTSFYPVALATDVQMFVAFPCWQRGAQ